MPIRSTTAVSIRRPCSQLRAGVLGLPWLRVDDMADLLHLPSGDSCTLADSSHLLHDVCTVHACAVVVDLWTSFSSQRLGVDGCVDSVGFAPEVSQCTVRRKSHRASEAACFH
eukprot:TRINITY_DN104025_c0_g1_i1.p1 TRINITY_DN104025_c0_g1~~TRINITY_DN104025_c0_g1_i1.p1  ORF type:complete len:113 (-),score=0.97 TRINITY_DN104025_c0_g1_i1:8-346(-)